MYVILPFEKQFYADEGVEVEFVGHPLMDQISQLEFDPVEMRNSLGLDARPVLAILPGSRHSEIKFKLPIMATASDAFPEFQCVIAGVSNHDESVYREFMGGRDIPILFGQTYEILSLAEYGMITSGTATLETALFGVPQVVCYAGSALNNFLANLVIQVEYVSLVNLILGRESVKELLQENFTAENVVSELRSLIDNPDKKQVMMKSFEELREKLGDAGASQRTAKGMMAFLKS